MSRGAVVASRVHPRLTCSRREALALLGAAVVVTASPAAAQTVTSSANPAVDPVAPNDGTVEVLHGVRVEDPFRPLEDPARADVQAWIAAEDGKARLFLASNSLHAHVSEFLRASGRYSRTGGLRRVGRSFVAWALMV
jgi:prolyl oligopeptidase